MSKNGKYFVAPQKSLETFKVLFARLAAEGAGRPVDEHGFPDGPWSPEKIADAISSFDANSNGVELRTVQVWFQDNENGISDDNIRWLARIFGCADPDATSQWQAELKASRERLACERRKNRKHGAKHDVGPYNLKSFQAMNGGFSSIDSPNQVASLSIDDQGVPRADVMTLLDWGTNDEAGGRVDYKATNETEYAYRSSWIALISERMFLDGGPFNITVVLWTFVALLLFTSFILGVHDVTFSPVEGVTKQVGLFWSPNWLIDKLIWLPLLVIFVSNVLTNWKMEWRLSVLSDHAKSNANREWQERLGAFSLSFWGIAFVSFAIVFLLQWYGGYLKPLLQNDVDRRVVDWLLVSIERPEIMTTTESIFVSMFANFFSGLGYWYCFAGLLLLYIISIDFKDICRRSAQDYDLARRQAAFGIASEILRGVYCSAVVMIIASLGIKLVSIYLMTDAENIVGWLIQDARSAVGLTTVGWNWFDKNPTASITSFFVLFIPCFVFLLCVSQIFRALGRISFEMANISQKEEISTKAELKKLQAASIKWMGIMLLLVVNFWLIGRFSGFSILLFISVSLAIYSVIVARRYQVDEAVS